MVYKITNYSYRKAEENDLTIKPSTKNNKKLMFIKMVNLLSQLVM